MIGEPHAWIDESVHVNGPGPDTGFYVLAATITDSERHDTLRTTMRELVVSPTRRLHWNAETAPTRLLVAGTIGGLDLAHLTVVAPAEATRQERARRKCLERLLYELDQRDVSRVWLESRQKAQDRRDQAMVAALHGSGGISAKLSTRFARPLDEPMLWIPDAIAGMTTADERTGTNSWTEHLGHRHRRIRL